MSMAGVAPIFALVEAGTAQAALVVVRFYFKYEQRITCKKNPLLNAGVFGCSAWVR